MKRILGLSLFAATIAFANSPTVDPAKTLFDAGIRQTQDGKFEAARLTLQTLVNTYPKDPLALEAKGAIDATPLFEEGQSRTKAGKYETARLAFETLIAVYPENPLVDRAKAALETISDKEKANHKVLKAMVFRDVNSVPEAEIRAAMEARELRLTEGKAYRSRDIEQAKLALVEILAEKGVANARVQAQTLTVPPNAVDVVFTVERPRGSLLGAPFRLAAAGWHKVRPGSDSQNAGL